MRKRALFIKGEQNEYFEKTSIEDATKSVNAKAQNIREFAGKT